MTDRSKSQRKRRLQLNAEDFTPPTDMHQSTDEPRLDDAWVQYYGGEKLGGLKRLTSLDDDSQDDSNNSEPTGPPEITIPPGTDNISEIESQTSLHSAQQPEPPSVNLQEVPADNRTQNMVAPIRDFYRQEKAQTADIQSALRAIEAEKVQSPSVRQVDTKGISFPKLHVDSSRTPANSDLAVPSFESWSKRWTPWLKRGGSIKVCEAFFLMTHAQGKAECFTSNSEIMKRTELSRAQCIRNIHYLIEMGFLDELNEVNNREAKGTYYRFNLIPKSLAGQ